MSKHFTAEKYIEWNVHDPEWRDGLKAKTRSEVKTRYRRRERAALKRSLAAEVEVELTSELTRLEEIAEELALIDEELADIDEVEHVEFEDEEKFWFFENRMWDLLDYYEELELERIELRAS